jgi:hypothetical protein
MKRRYFVAMERGYFVALKRGVLCSHGEGGTM